jgi:hypothetical protein
MGIWCNNTGEQLSYFVQAGGATARSVEQVEVTAISYSAKDLHD